MNYKKIGGFIKGKRLEKGISQYELADMIVISREAVSKWERGVSLPDISILSKLANILEISVEELLIGEEIEKDKDKFFNKILNVLNINNKLKKVIFIIASVFLISLLFFFIYYFNISYDSVKVYKFQSDMNNDVYIKDGMIILTNKKVIFKGGFIEGRNYGTDNIRNNLEHVLIYYVIDNVKYEIWGYDKDEQSFYRDNIISERLGYSEYFYSENLNKMIDNMYINIKFFDREYTSKLEFEELYSNKELDKFKFDHI